MYNGGTLAMINCTVSGNSVSGDGGGVSSGTFRNYGPTLTMTNCTVSGNSGYYGGGLLATGTATLTNTIVAGNSGSDIDAASASGTNNLIGTGDAGGLVNGADGNLVGVTNPLLAPLGNYGGPTQTMALLPGSPAIDARNQQPGAPPPTSAASPGSAPWTSAPSSRAGSPSPSPRQRPVGQRHVSRPAGRDRHGEQPDRAGRRGFGHLHPAGQRGVGDDLGKPGGHRASGTASVTAASNFIGGSYTVSATATGAPARPRSP